MFTKIFIPFCALFVSLSLAAEPGARAESWQPPQDPTLRQSLAAFERGFAQQNLALLSRLFQHQSKVLVRWDQPVRQDGLLTGTQVLLLLNDLFKQYRTEKFSLQSGALLPPGEIYHCMGRWAFVAPSGQHQDIELHLSLRQEAGAWIIRELRQTR